MKPICALDIEYNRMEINDIPVLFTTDRVERKSLPTGYYAYDIRSDDTGDNDFATIEPVVTVNRTGTIISKEPIEMTNGDYTPVDDYNFLGEIVKIEIETDFEKLIEKYKTRLESYLSEIDRVCQLPNNERKSAMPTSPNYLTEVIIPVYELTAEYLRKKRRKLKIPNAETYHPIKEYYRIKIGLTTVGGFSVPDGEDFSIYFTPLKSALPIGERVKVYNAEQLGELIFTHLQKHKE